jgi:hypothetical protein
MTSPLIQYLRLMIEAYLYDGAYQSEEESQPYSLVESTTVLAGFKELMRELETRKQRDEEFRSRVQRTTAEMAEQLNGAILLNTNDLKCEDAKLLSESVKAIEPGLRPRVSLSNKIAAKEFLEKWREEDKRRHESAQEQASLWGIEVDEVPRWKALSEASVQDAEILLLKYMLVSFSRLRKAELYHDMLKINDLHNNERYGLKRTMREAFLCRVFGFDQGAAALCGASIEYEARRRLVKLGVVEIRNGKWAFGTAGSTFPDRQMSANDMLEELHALKMLDSEVAGIAHLLEKGKHVLELRNDALHTPEEFNRKLRLKEFENFVPDTRDVLQAIQEPAQ